VLAPLPRPSQGVPSLAVTYLSATSPGCPRARRGAEARERSTSEEWYACVWQETYRGVHITTFSARLRAVGAPEMSSLAGMPV
jgi:hypothetical protein